MYYFVKIIIIIKLFKFEVVLACDDGLCVPANHAEKDKFFDNPLVRSGFLRGCTCKPSPSPFARHEALCLYIADILLMPPRFVHMQDRRHACMVSFFRKLELAYHTDHTHISWGLALFH